ncbi:MAG: nucleotidyltransferase family protein [Bacteroidales bacterium]|jgi:NDP-sugar pyrophosphorylase family protein|nr:nucleotidyltransferase family protein [Bacteroidales bacterium]
MEGFILAAGLGTRLRPLTNDRPKALVEINGVTLLEMAIHRLEAVGIRHIVVNVHHFGDKVIDFIHSRRWEAVIDISDERSMLLDTGGGLKQASTLFSGHEPVLVHNVDILSNIDLQTVAEVHLHDNNLVTLCVSQRDTARQLLFSSDGHLLGRKGEVEAPDGTRELAFSGVSIVSPKLFDLLPPATAPYPVIPCYIELAHTHRIVCFEHDAAHWLDMGKPETLEIAKQWMLSSNK